MLSFSMTLNLLDITVDAGIMLDIVMDLPDKTWLFDRKMTTIKSFICSLVVFCLVFIHNGTSSFMLADDKQSQCVGSLMTTPT